MCPWLSPIAEKRILAAPLLFLRIVNVDGDISASPAEAATGNDAAARPTAAVSECLMNFLLSECSFIFILNSIKLKNS
jgi:hypothetical protein